MNRVLDILSSIRPDVDFTREKLLIDDGILDSFDIIAIVGELNDAFGIDINAGDLEPDNFNSAHAIWGLVQSLQR